MRYNLPDHMQVVEISRPGGPEVLKVATRPLPRPKTGEVLIRVAAAGVNRPDCLQRSGDYPPPPGDSALREKVWPLMEAKKIRPVIFRVFPLAEAGAAHALMKSGAHIGKILLEVADN